SQGAKVHQTAGAVGGDVDTPAARVAGDRVGDGADAAEVHGAAGQGVDDDLVVDVVAAGQRGEGVQVEHAADPAGPQGHDVSHRAACRVRVGAGQRQGQGHAAADGQIRPVDVRKHWHAGIAAPAERQ